MFFFLKKLLCSVTVFPFSVPIIYRLQRSTWKIRSPHISLRTVQQTPLCGYMPITTTNLFLKAGLTLRRPKRKGLWLTCLWRHNGPPVLSSFSSFWHLLLGWASSGIAAAHISVVSPLVGVPGEDYPGHLWDVWASHTPWPGQQQITQVYKLRTMWTTKSEMFERYRWCHRDARANLMRPCASYNLIS